MTWPVLRLRRVCRLQSGLTVDGSREVTGDAVTHPYLRVANVQAGWLNLDNVAEISVPRSIAASTMLRPGDVLMTEGGDLDKLGRGTVWRGEIPVCLHQNHVFAVRPHAGVLDARYLAYVTQSSNSRHYFESSGTKTTNLASTSSSKILDLPIPCPPFVEQRRVADFLDEETARLDNVLSTLNSALDRLQERRVSGIHHAVTGGSIEDRRPSNLPWASTLPAKWRTVKLSLAAQMGSGHTPSRSHPEWWTDCTIPWITTGEISQVRDDRREVIFETREKISHVGIANSSAELHPEGTVVLCRTASAGYSGVMGNDMATSQDFVTWTCGPRLDPFYLLWCLRAMRGDLLGRLAMGSTHKTIYVPDLQMLRIPLPPIEEQRSIVSTIRNTNRQIDSLVDAIEAQLALLTERRQAVITAVVMGQINVTAIRMAMA